MQRFHPSSGCLRCSDRVPSGCRRQPAEHATDVSLYPKTRYLRGFLRRRHSAHPTECRHRKKPRGKRVCGYRETSAACALSDSTIYLVACTNHSYNEPSHVISKSSLGLLQRLFPWLPRRLAAPIAVNGWVDARRHPRLARPSHCHPACRVSQAPCTPSTSPMSLAPRACAFPQRISAHPAGECSVAFSYTLR